MYRITQIPEMDRWAVIDEDGGIIMYSVTKEGAIQIMEDLNGTL